MPTLMDSKFPPGLLNPGTSGAAVDGAAHWCMRLLGVECPNRQEFIFNVFFTSHGVWMLLPLSVVLLLLYRLVGPPEVCWCPLFASMVGVLVCSLESSSRANTAAEQQCVLLLTAAFLCGTSLTTS